MCAESGSVSMEGVGHHLGRSTRETSENASSSSTRAGSFRPRSLWLRE